MKPLLLCIFIIVLYSCTKKIEPIDESKLIGTWWDQATTMAFSAEYKNDYTFNYTVSAGMSSRAMVEGIWMIVKDTLYTSFTNKDSSVTKLHMSGIKIVELNDSNLITQSNTNSYDTLWRQQSKHQGN